MDPCPIECIESLHIGTVEFVSPSKIEVLLDIEAPDSIALNTGTPRPFPRINGYVLIPNDEGYLVGQVNWLTIERSSFPKRRGMQDFGLIDLPYPLRKMGLNPLGTLQKTLTDSGEEGFRFNRGVDAFPSVGDSVLIPTGQQLRSIVESGKERWVKIGTSPLAGNADVCIDPDRIFGRHLAVLGNTGSGKSCSVAGLIRWSLESVPEGITPNARFIILDPNGEYTNAFANEKGSLKPRIYKVDAQDESCKLKVPLWFWNSSEWCSFTMASDRMQRPLLQRALREVKAGRTDILKGSDEEKKLSLRRYLTSKVISIRRDLRSGAIQTEESKFGFRLKAINEDLLAKKEDFPSFSEDITKITECIKIALSATYNFFYKDGELVEFYRAFTEKQVETIINSMTELLGSLGGIILPEGPTEDMPINFSGTDLCDHLSILAEDENVTQFLDFLVMRMRTLLSDTRIKPIISDAQNISLEEWLTKYIGSNKSEDGCLTIIDLSLVPPEIISIVTAVIARMVFEALQRYRKFNQNQQVLPTVLVMEEAHTFVKRYRDDGENQDASTVCCRVFERIAREGRKYGLGLVLSSQRPSELSPTVLSQCNSFLLHRISNDLDQDLVNRYVPDNLRGLLDELPSLPSQKAILLGWASELPVLVRMNDLPINHQPQSKDPDFWDVWTGKEARDVNWKKIADDWQGKG